MDSMVTTEESIRTDYLDFKVKVLYQLGLTDTKATKEHLKHKSKNAESELKRKIQIDNVARKMLMDFYDGDRTYIKSKNN